MICLFYVNFVKFAKELSKSIHGIRINLTRLLIFTACLLLAICKFKSHIMMPIIVDIYYYHGDIIFTFITGSEQSCNSFLSLYDWVWAIL